jgi:hypothetical protein
MDRKVATVIGAGLASIAAFLVYSWQDDEPKLKKDSYKMKGVRDRKKTGHLMARENDDDENEISSISEDESDDDSEDESEEEEEEEDEEDEEDEDDEDKPPTKKRSSKNKK